MRSIIFNPKRCQIFAELLRSTCVFLQWFCRFSCCQSFSFFFLFRFLVNLAVDLKCVWSLRETVTDNFTSTGDCSMAER